MPDYGGIATAAGGAWSRKVDGFKEVEDAVKEAILVVLQEGRSAVVDCIVGSI